MLPWMTADIDELDEGVRRRCLALWDRAQQAHAWALVTSSDQAIIKGPFDRRSVRPSHGRYDRKTGRSA
jgi:hypothetical protein